MEPITVTFPDGKTTDAKAWQSTPYDVAKSIRFERITNCTNVIIRSNRIKNIFIAKDLLITQ